jgi:tripartite motif-containing protein 71
MNRMLLLMVVLVSLLLSFSLNRNAFSWIEQTHKDLSDFGAKNSVLDKNKGDYLNNLGFENGLDEGFKWNETKTLLEWIQEGAELEDKSAPLFPLFGTSRSVNHFHNPLKPWSIAGLDDTVLVLRYTGESSLLWSQDGSNQLTYPEGDWSWQTIRNCYYVALTAPSDSGRQANFAKTFRGLGHQLHLIQDGAQPDHVRNNAHPWDTTGLKRWIGIEKWANDNPSFINSSAADPNIQLSFSPQVSFDASYNDLAPISQLFDALQYSGSNPSTSLNQGITEYTNGNFFSDDTIFAAERYSPSHRHYFPYPKRGSTDLQSYIDGTKPPETIITEDGLEDTGFWISKESDGEKVKHFLKVGLATRIIYKLLGEGELFYRSFHRDEECHKDYAKLLIPRAVGYSAGLLNYFFRGKLYVEQTGVTPSAEIEITITNLSEEPLVDGTFELYYDNKDGERVKLELSATEVKGLQKETPFTTSFRRPSDFEAGKEDKYMLVYSGKMGLEEKAYIGKYGFIGRVLPAMVTYDPDEMKAFFKIGKRGEDEGSHDFFIDLGPALKELGHDHIDPISLKIVEYSANLGILVYTVNETTCCVLMFEVLGLSSPPVTINGYRKRDFVWDCDQFDMSNDTIDPIPAIPNLVYGTPGKPQGVADIWFNQDRYPSRPDYYTLIQAVGVESTPGGFTIYGPEGFEDVHLISNTYADSVERAGVNLGSGPQTIAVPIGFSLWLTNKEGHLADIRWVIHFSCLAGYLLNFRYEIDYQYPQGGSFRSSWIDGFPANAPFMLVKERGQNLRLEDPMHIFDSVWVYDYLSAFGGEPMTGDVEFSGPTTHSDPHTGVRLNHYWAVKSGSQWPGSYRRAYPVLNSETGVLAKYVVHCTRPNFSGALTMSPESIDHFIDSLFICAISPTYDTGIRPPGFYYLSDSLTFRENTRPNGRFAYHAGGGSPDRMMLRIAPESYLAPDYNPTSSKDRSIYIIDGQVYDYDQPVPLLFGDTKVSRELLVAQSIYGMNKPAVVDSTIDLYGGGTLTGKMKGYLDLEVYDGNRYFSDFGIIKQPAASEPLEIVETYPDTHTNNAPINSKVTVQFDTPVDILTVNSASFSLVESVSGTRVSGNFSFDFNDRVVIFTPSSNLNPLTIYTLSMTSAIESAEGVPFSQLSWSFTTGGLADTVSPTITISPPNGATQVPVNAWIVFGFSEPMNPISINSSTITVANNGLSVSGNITLSQQNTVATFTPISSFLPNSVVNVTLSRKVTDVAGNPIVGSTGPGTDFMSSFTTASAADTVPPQILNVSPLSGATGVDISTAISVTFSEAINPMTVNGQTFTLSVGATQYSGQFSFSEQNTIVTFTPDQPFPTNSIVTITLSAGIRDIAGNGMPLPFASSFTTYQGGPILAIAYSEATTRTVGETIHIGVANTGDGDTTSTFTMKLTDSKGLLVCQNTINDTITAGGSKTYAIQIPNQAADGGYLLYAEVTDTKNKKTSASFDLKITGLNATLNTRTGKDVYLPTEAVAGITTVMNGPFGIENGSLKVSVSGIASTAAGGFKHFLPKEVGAIFYYPWGIAVGPDGSVYVVDTDSHCIQRFDSNGNFITKWGSFGGDDGQFYYPNSIAVGSDGSVYVADTENHRIQKFDSSGTFIRTWGTEGSGNGQFYEPSGIAISSDGYVYVADTGNHRVQKFSSNGSFILKWGALGQGDGQFNSPYGVGVGPDGSVYVAETYNARVQKFNGNGNFITQWGSFGSGDGQFHWPCGIAIGPDGSVYVADANSDRIQKFSGSGTFIAKWGSSGEGDGQFYGPSGIAIGGDNSVYVTDSGNNRVEKFGNNGTFIAKWGSGGQGDGAFAEPSGIAIGPDGSIYLTDTYQDRIQKFDAAGNFRLKWGTYGYGNGEFETPSSVAVGPDGSVYVADRNNKVVQKFDSSGGFVLAWYTYGSESESLSPKGIAVGPDGLIYVVVEPAYPSDDEVQKFDMDGNYLTQWAVPYYSDGIAIGPDGFVYVVAPELNLIQKFDMDGNYLMQWGSYGTGDGEFNSPQEISVGPDGYIYLADTGNYRIQKFDGDGNFIAKWGSYGWQEGQFDQPHGVAIASDGSVYVADAGNHRIQKKIGENTPQTFLEATLSINQSASTNQDYSTNIGALGVTGKLYLQATLTNSLGQTLGQSSYSFYLFTGDIALLFNTDKKSYNPGETITITGRVENRGATDVANLVFNIYSKLLGQNSKLLYTESFDLPAGNSRPFVVTTSAGAAGTVILTSIVSQGGSTLAEIKDKYEVVNP